MQEGKKRKYQKFLVSPTHPAHQNGIFSPLLIVNTCAGRDNSDGREIKTCNGLYGVA